MTRMLALALILVLVCLPASAASYTAPTVPDSGQALMPEDTADFGKALMELVRKALTRLRPDPCARWPPDPWWAGVGAGDALRRDR